MRDELSTYQQRLLHALAARGSDAKATAAELAEAISGVGGSEAAQRGRNGNAAQHLRRLAEWGYVRALDSQHWTLAEQGWAAVKGWAAA